MKVILIFVLFGSLAYGHNWMQSPLSYNGNKAKAGNLPCNAETATYTDLTPAIGDTIPVTWTTNHGGNHFVKVVASTDIETVEDIATPQTDAKVLFYFEGDKTAGKTATITVDSTKYTAGQTYVLQYSWAKYRNCARFTVSALVNPTAAPTAPTAPTGTAPTAPTAPTATPIEVGSGDCAIYCEDFQRQCSGTQWSYSDANECLESCALFPFSGQDRDSTGNTFQCRWYHLHPDPDHAPDDEVHCSHASKESTTATCTGGDFQKGATLTIKTDPLTQVTPAQLKGYVEECLVNGGYTSVSVADPSQQNNEYQIQIVFTDDGNGGESLDQKLIAVKADQFLRNCVANKEGVESLGVARTDNYDSHSRGSPTIVLSVIAILLCMLFQ